MGDPCISCGLPALSHRVEHEFVGRIVERCGYCQLPISCHRMRTRQREDNRVRRGRKQPDREQESLYLGIDGEGQGRLKHRYVLLAAADETGTKTWHVKNFHSGLTTEQCLTFCVDLPQYARTFAYSFNYDMTKMLQDVDDEALYLLFRPELRQRTGREAYKGPYPVRWRDWNLNLQGTKFSITRTTDGRQRIIWDIWKFYQSKFVSALEDWKVGDKAKVENMKHMKDKRADFDKESEEDVTQYCYDECQYMAELARKLVDAHIKAGLKLKSFYGAGSSASAMLTKMGVKEKITAPPVESRKAIASGFSGGRFENSVVGMIPGPVFSFDISSAYPYQLYQLPCLLHGEWSTTTDRADILNASAALVHYGWDVSAGTNSHKYWSAFPFRTSEGNICYPYTSPGGWVWRDEYIQGEKMFPGVRFKEAWVYNTSCDCNPFNDIPHYYRERHRIGKEGPGIVLKLGMNSCYGKLAQSVGRGPFNSWVWAGIITSGCRAQILQLMAAHKDPKHILMIATDGIQTTEDVETPKPVNTDTWETGKPLGGWERKVYEKGVFYARPGVYFPLDPTKEEIKHVRGRGVGRGVVFENWREIVSTWHSWHGRGEWPIAEVANVSRFCGAKSSISRSILGYDSRGKLLFNHKRAVGNHLDPIAPEPRYGEWITRKVSMSFHPMPKRAGLLDNGPYLELRTIDGTVESMPYKKAFMSKDAKDMSRQYNEMLEQPDGDLADYETAAE